MEDQLDALFAHYGDKSDKFQGTIIEIFSGFNSLDLSLINDWLQDQFENNRILKNDNISTMYRQQGNKFFAKKDLSNSLDFYTRSLCWATPYGKEYGLAIANRSAVTFEMREFEDCLKDIEICLNNSNYPIDLKPKVQIRKAECLFELGKKDVFQDYINEMISIFNNASISDKDKYMAKLKQIKKSRNHKPNTMDMNYKNVYDIPTFPDGENENFVSASPKVHLSYDKDKGRHVVAKENIKRGDILFIEKAFSFAPVFKKNKEFIPFKCYHCLKDFISGIPCHFCVVCIYCEETCRNVSWSHGHKWECPSIQANIWYGLGIGFPAFKTLLKGIPSGFGSMLGNYKEDLKHFGNKTDNYPYFNRLLSNIHKSKIATPYVIALIITCYLKKYTDFFTWCVQQPNCPAKEVSNLVVYVGSAIAKHIAQLACNSCMVEHWTSSSQDLLFPDEVICVASGIFPSVSMMNHSCKPNVSNYFICDTIVVKASEDIKANDEIFNCYGIDYRDVPNRQQRQNACRSLYYFECKCVVCEDPSKEVEVLNSFLCPNCKGSIPEMQTTLTSFCMNCGRNYPLAPFKKINEAAQKYLEQESSSPLPLLLKCLHVRNRILHKHHKDFEEVYYKLYSYFVDKGDAENMLKYFQLWLANEKARIGENSRSIGTKLYEAALAILHCLQTGPVRNNVNLKAFLQNVEYMIKEAKIILNLYYPPYITERLNSKLHLISTK